MLGIPGKTKEVSGNDPDEKSFQGFELHPDHTVQTSRLQDKELHCRDKGPQSPAKGM